MSNDDTSEHNNIILIYLNNKIKLNVFNLIIRTRDSDKNN